MYRRIDVWIADLLDVLIGYAIAGFAFGFGLWVFWSLLGAMSALIG